MGIRVYDSMSFGRDVPAMGPFRNFNPKFVGPAGGKVKAIIYTGYKLSRFIASRPWAKGTLTGTAIGTGLGLNGENETGNNNNQALRAVRQRSGRIRRHKKYGANTRRGTSCCHKCSRCC